MFHGSYNPSNVFIYTVLLQVIPRHSEKMSLQSLLPLRQYPVSITSSSGGPMVQWYGEEGVPPSAPRPLASNAETARALGFPPDEVQSAIDTRSVLYTLTPYSHDRDQTTGRGKSHVFSCYIETSDFTEYLQLFHLERGTTF
jgi:hypothetical protein